VYERWSQDEKAIEAYRKAADLDSTKVGYLLAVAELQIAQKKFEEARATLEPKLAHFENSAPMHQLLGQVCMLLDDPKLAAEHYNRAMLIDPKLPLIHENLIRAQFASGEWEDCLETARRAQREGKDGRTIELMRIEGRCLAMLDRPSEARAVFAEITRERPDDVEAWIDLAAAAWELDELSRVTTAANRLLKIAPNRYEAYVLKGLVAEANGEEIVAQDWYRKATAVAKKVGVEPELLTALHDTVVPSPAVQAGVTGDGDAP
jgi:tetratricopeptide (TPR) repeat protein